MNLGLCGFVLVIHAAAICVSAQAKHGKATGVCKQPTTHGTGPKALPTLPQTYIARVECNIVNKNFSTDVHEFYDYKGNRGAVHQFEEGMEMWGIYDYTLNELLIVTPGDNNLCQVTDLATSSNKFIFGDSVSSSASKGGHIYSVSGAMRFGGNFSETYVGKQAVRGIPCNHWWSCQYWKGMDATMNVNWYFSDPTNWNSSIGPVSVPVRLEVIGVVYDTPTSTPRNFHHFYEFADFRETFYSPREFEIPAQTYCPGRKNKKPLPTPPQFFSFEGEILTKELKTIGWIKEFYDYDSKLMRWDYVPLAGQFAPYGSRLLTEVHDFTTGLAYIMDRMLGNCTVKQIEKLSFDTKMVDPAHVRIRSAKEFFNFANTQYAYEGIRKVRDMDCDVWIARRTDWPPGVQGLNSTWEWYFATSQWSDNTGQKIVFSQPIMLEVYAPDLGIHYIYNMFNYNEDVPDMWDFNIGPCYMVNMKQDISFKLGNTQENFLLQHQLAFRRGLYKSIATAAGISPLRISNLQIQYLQKEVDISFTMLSAPGITGDVTNAIYGPKLADAASVLQNLINGEQFYVTVNDSSAGQIVKFQAGAHSFKKSGISLDAGTAGPLQQAPSSKNYTSGDLVAIGLCMMFGCFVIACAVMYVIYKKKGGAWDSFIPKSFDSGKDEKK